MRRGQQILNVPAAVREIHCDVEVNCGEYTSVVRLSFDGDVQAIDLWTEKGDFFTLKMVKGEFDAKPEGTETGR
jgi:hypothetical protein